MTRRLIAAPQRRALAIISIVLSCGLAWAQQNESQPDSAGADAAVHELGAQVRELRALVEEMRAENAQSRTEMKELREELQSTRKLLGPAAEATGAPVAQTNPLVAEDSDTSTPVDLASRVQNLEDSAQLMGSKVDEQYQTKVETAGRYRARLSGIILMNAFRNIGNSDNLDIPNYAQPTDPGWPQAALGATLRQTEIGLEIFGPNVAGAKTSANVQFDFAGGLAATPNGVNFGIVRLQTGSLRLDWKDTSLVAGQDSLFFSPLSPTSFASLATPAFANAGNLWGWTPQIRIEHRFDLADEQKITVQAGVLDNLDWEYPTDPYYRNATSGESSGQPAYALRTAWSSPVTRQSWSR